MSNPWALHFFVPMAKGSIQPILDQTVFNRFLWIQEFKIVLSAIICFQQRDLCLWRHQGCPFIHPHYLNRIVQDTGIVFIVHGLYAGYILVIEHWQGLPLVARSYNLIYSPRLQFFASFRFRDAYLLPWTQFFNLHIWLLFVLTV